eukprot:328624_1
MSTAKKRFELLTFGYINKIYGIIPAGLIKLIHSFYNEWFYWIFNEKKLKPFVNTNNHETISCPTLFKMKGIEFEIFSYPNGRSSIWKGLVHVGFKLKCFPTNMEYATFYQEIKYEAFNSKIFISKKLRKISADTTSEMLSVLCPLSELINMKNICFGYLINIKYIKYKQDTNKIAYYSHTNKTIKSFYKFTWNINGLLIQQCKTMMKKQPIYSNDFDHNNWCLMMVPNGLFSDNELPMIFLKCFRPFHSFESMDVKVIFSIDGVECEESVCSIGHAYIGMLAMNTSDRELLSRAFKEKTAVLLVFTLEIGNVYDKNKNIIDRKEWSKHDIS